MQIGLDLDNTIVSYDRVFGRLGREAGLPEDVVRRGKTAIRDFMCQQGRESEWTEMQGLAYGPGMRDAEPFSGVLQFARSACASGHNLHVVSHRTKHPILGKPFDLHAAAREWLSAVGIAELASVFLEEKVENKAARITTLKCDIFVDDLPEFLARPDLPQGLRKICFAPEGGAICAGADTVRSWREVATLLLSE